VGVARVLVAGAGFAAWEIEVERWFAAA
jgi:hypothetical protein